MQRLHALFTAVLFSSTLAAPVWASSPDCETADQAPKPILHASVVEFITGLLVRGGWSCQCSLADTGGPGPQPPTPPEVEPLEFSFDERDFKDGDWQTLSLANNSDSTIKFEIEFQEVASGDQQGRMEVVVLPGKSRKIDFYLSFEDDISPRFVTTQVRIYIPEDAATSSRRTPHVMVRETSQYTNPDIKPRTSKYECSKQQCREDTGGGTKKDSGPAYPGVTGTDGGPGI